MRNHATWRRKLAAGAVALSMTLSMVPTIAVAEEGDVPEWAYDDGENQEVFPQAELPASYDLRNDGLVTPVKSQGNWGSCWSFGGIAAAESSILSARGATADSGLDLSEKHLAWFAYQPVTEAENEAQAGEGIHVLSDDPNRPYNIGGAPILVSSLFSRGVGPVEESLFPYQGATGRLKLDDLNEDPTSTVWQELESKYEVLATLAGKNLTHEEIIKYELENLANQHVEGIETEQDVINYWKDKLAKDYTKKLTFSTKDDWTIPATDGYGYSNRLKNGGFVLKDGNILPDYRNADGSINDNAVRAIKQELVNGRAVSVGFYAASNYMDKGMVYVPEKQDANHAVCIVGWDDNFDFAEHQFSEEEPRKLPSRKGAWIIKNSWGSQTDCIEVAEGSYLNYSDTAGYVNEDGLVTGYYYISYEDMSLAMAETLNFSSNLADAGEFFSFQHDYVPARIGYDRMSSDKTLSAANVFETDDVALELRSVATSTVEANMRVTFAIYELADGATDPTDGNLLARFSRNFEYGGFHRVDLDTPVTIGAGKRFSVVSTASLVREDGSRTYSAMAALGIGEDEAKSYHLPMYIQAIINEGESYLYRDGAWQDWKEASPATLVGDYEGGLADNFPIKAYGVRAEEQTLGGATRLSGREALDTMAAIVRAANYDAGGTVVLTTLDGYWDALTASGIAGLTGAPVLMTSGAALSEQTADLIGRLAPTQIIVCGGTSSVSDDVMNAAAAAAGDASVTRLSGARASDTAVAIHEGAYELTPATWSSEAFLCTSEGYWDALAASPVSYALAIPIFLTDGVDEVSDATINSMKEYGIETVYIVGGTSSVSAQAEQKLRDAGIGIGDERLAGTDAIATSERVAAFGLARGMHADGMGVATTSGYWDALSGSALCGKTNSPIVLVGDESSSSISGFIASNASDIHGVYILGGRDSVSQETMEAVLKAIG